MFARGERLRKSVDIQYVVTHGHRAQTANLRVYWLNRGPSHQGPHRLTVVVGKKVHKSAVIRNRIKRRVRSALKETHLPDGIDAVVLPKITALKLPFDLIKEDLAKIKHEII